jgi:hypothetical protein
MPAVLPAAADLKEGLRVLEELNKPADQRHIDYCLAKLITGFQAAWDKPTVTAQRAIWIEVNGELPHDLWSLGTIELLKTHKFGMPKPVHLREKVGAMFEARTTMLKRIRAMMVAAGPKSVAVEPYPVRLRHMVETGLKRGRMQMAITAELKLAALENRAPADWVKQPIPPPPRDDDLGALPAPPDSPAMQARLLPARIRARAALMGENHPGVVALRAELARLQGAPVADDAGLEPEGA